MTLLVDAGDLLRLIAGFEQVLQHATIAPQEVAALHQGLQAWREQIVKAQQPNRGTR